MPTKTKLDQYTELLSRSVNWLHDSEKWLSFLETASRLYKYKFRDQIMIHAQKPNATACADYDLWRRKDLADRQVKAGSKGIALLEDNGNRTNLRYVFDYADTEARSDKKLFLWQITNENENAITEMLSKKYGADDKNMYSALLDTAKQLANEYGGDYANELIDYTEGTFLEELDDFNVWVEFSQTLENSIAYTLLARCGYSAADYFDMDDFQHLRDFNGIGAMTVLGKAVSELSEQALRDIERTVKTFERNKQHEQDITDRRSPSQNNNRETVGRNGVDLHSGRGNADLPPESDVRGTAKNRILREDEGEIPQREQTDPVRNNVHQGNAESVLGGHGTASEGLRDRTDNADGEVGRGDGAVEIDQSNGVGTADEQLQAKGEGDSPNRNDIHLTADEYGGFLPSEHLSEILKHDKNMNAKKPQVLDYFLEHEDKAERAEFMRLAYSLDFTTVEVADRLYAYQKTDEGLQIHLGGKKTAIPWETVQAHVADLIAKHEYLDEPKIDIDVSDTAFNEADFFMPEPAVQMSLFGDDVDFEPQKSTKVAGFSQQFSETDEQIIKTDLMRGSNFQDGKFRIDDFAKTNPSTADFAKFLSKEYGIGGGSTPEGFSNHDGKGIKIDIYNRENGEYQKARSITLNWNQVAKRISELVRNGEYITDEDVSQRIKHAEYVLNNYDPSNEMDLQQIEEAEKVLALYGMFETDDIQETVEITEILINSAPETEEEPDEYIFKVGDILELDEGIFEVTQVDGDIIELTDTTTDETCVINENELYNTGFAVIEGTAIIPENTENIEELPEVETEIETDEIDPLSLIGKHYVIDGREMIVEKVDVEWNSVSFADVHMFQTGYPIFRSETVDFLLNIEEQEREKADIDITDIATSEPETELPEPTAVSELPKLKKDLPNFRITDDNLGIGGAKEKFKNNIAAITLLKEIENDFNRIPNPEEQETLSKYVGWGGMPQAFDDKNSAWSDEYITLKNTLSDFEYDSARESTLNAHYTSPTVIKAIYEGLENLGFKSGNVLEPAMGVGNFFGLMPETMNNSKLYGVELDDISGRIAKQLYPKADISIRGFEEKQFPDNFFDVAIGNVPFGGYKLSEKRYDKLNLNIHDHFFAKALDKVRPGGVIAFVTSKGTLDKQNPSFRKYLAERAELLGAIRLPNTTFKANAGTEVTSDIIFLQKRESVMDIEPEWVKLGKTTDEISVNQYFLDNPEMLLGTMTNDSGTRMYGNENSTTCLPFEGADLAKQLKTAIANIKGNIPEYEHDDEKIIDSIPADENVRNFSFTLVNDNIYYRENSRMNRIDFPKATEERIKAMIELRDCVRDLIDYQLNEYGESDIRNQQFKLNNLYDNFKKKYGLINSKANRNAFSEDNSYYLLTSLEVLNEKGTLERKADMFTKRTIKARRAVSSVDTASEALAVSIAEKAKVDLPFMQELTGFDKDKLIEDLRGVIYKVPLMNDTEKYVTADEYLSGNIREKLETARNFNEAWGMFGDNVKALEQVMPKPLEACDIDVRLGVNWIEPEYIMQFICETLQTPYYVKNSLDVKYSNYTAEWHVEGKNLDTRNVLANMTFGTGRKNAYSIIEDSLNLRDVRIFDYEQQPDGSKKAILNKKETMLAQEKQETIKQAFKDWIFKEPNRRQTLVEKYNVMFNSTRPREYDGSHITFSGMNPEITLNLHQRNAVAHALYGGNTLFAHCIGAGKTYEMCATAMESKRLALCNKSLIVVPNHITEQIGSDFMRLYPSANILVATKKDFEAKNRRRLCAKIACGDYDAVIIGHSQLEKIPVSPERQERLLRKQIHDITMGIEEMKYSRGEKFTVKQLEKTKKSLETRLKKLTDTPKRDSVVTFEELGVDKLFVDESHGFNDV